MKKFGKLKMDIRFFYTFYSKFIKLRADLKFKKKILIQKFMHKLFPYMKDQIISELKYLDNITNLTMRFRKI